MILRLKKLNYLVNKCNKFVSSKNYKLMIACNKCFIEVNGFTQSRGNFF